jgi:hypothetical protein
MTQQIPDKPEWLTSEEWQYVLERDQHQCACVNQCRLAGKLGEITCCSTKLHVDHIQPKCLGGDDSWANSRLLCDIVNCGRLVEPSEHWAQANYWDHEITVTNLRQIQIIAGYEAVQHHLVSSVLTEHRNDLLKRITLLPGVTGIGKSIMAEAVCFAINKVVNAAGLGRPRVKKVLFLATDRILRGQAVNELANDAYNYGIITHRCPSVVAFDQYSDFQRGPGDHDLVVACPQMLWEVQNNGNQRRSSTEVRNALRWFDTIFFDEADWASDQVRWIARLGSHALKFALTASPPVIPGVDTKTAEAFLRTCVLISTEAIADYRRTQQLDGCLKVIDETNPAGFIRCSEHDKYDVFLEGFRNTVDGQAQLDHPAFISAILRAVYDADLCESNMWKCSPKNYFSPHIIVRFDRVSDAIAAYEVLNHILPNQALQNKGWKAAIIFQGHTKRLTLPAEERDLNATRNGQFIHPFMRAKNLERRGIADDKSKRILLMCQIGVRGINHWGITSAVDCTEQPSIIDLTQFDIGRPIRLPNHLAHFLTDETLKEFITVRIYVPSVSGSEEKERRLSAARDFVLDMQQAISGRGFQTWADIIAGVRPEDGPSIDNDPSARPFTQQDRLALMNQMGIALEQNVNLANPEEIERIVSQLHPEAAGTRQRLAQKYVEKLRDDPVFRQEEVLCVRAEQESRSSPELVQTQLRPQDTYPINTLKHFVSTDFRFEKQRALYIESLNNNSPVVIDAVSQVLRLQQTILYKEPPRIWRLQGEGGALPIISGELTAQLLNTGLLSQGHRGEVPRALNSVAAKYFGVEDAKEGGPMDHHAYHVAILGRCRQTLQNLTRAHLVRIGILPNLARLVQL